MKDGSDANGNEIQVWDCVRGNTNQQWLVPPSGETGQIKLNKESFKCLDARNGQKRDGDPLQIWDCVDGDPNQQFIILEDGHIQWAGTDFCLKADREQDGSRMELWGCQEDGVHDMYWSAPQAIQIRNLEASEVNSTGLLGTYCEDEGWTSGSGRTCAWFAEHDPGCKDQPDEGQRSHCQKTCSTCQFELTGSSSTVINPWKDASWGYMPSVSDIAGCSTDSGIARGCDGGSTDSVWNQWMMNLDRPLWAMGSSCLPYNLKCFESSGVVNPLSSDSCSLFTDWDKWLRPCSCISKVDRPTGPICPSSVPTASCGVAVPFAMFTVSVVGQGLSIADAVTNMMNHILEFGPIYAGMSIKEEFMTWSWDKCPIYTGGTFEVGGHALLIVGWGSQAQGLSCGTYSNQVLPFWLVRNSWGSSWADKGYFKMLRGKNLDFIEEWEVSASMPAPDYQDFSPPICKMTTWSVSFTSDSSNKLASYSFKPQIVCSEDAVLKIWFSQRFNKEDEAYTAHYGTYVYSSLTAKVPKQLTVDFAKSPLCFGINDGLLWTMIEASSPAGEQGSTNFFTTLPKASGAVARSFASSCTS